MSNSILDFRASHGAKQIPDATREGTLPRVFGGTVNGLIVEAAVFNIAGQLARDYKGGYWEFVQLSDDGFYMCLPTERRYTVRALNGYAGEMSGDAFGITCCLYAYSNMSFDATGAFRDRLAELYHNLREYMLEHPECSEILGATD